VTDDRQTDRPRQKGEMCRNMRQHLRFKTRTSFSQKVEQLVRPLYRVWTARPSVVAALRLRVSHTPDDATQRTTRTTSCGSAAYIVKQTNTTTGSGLRRTGRSHMVGHTQVRLWSFNAAIKCSDVWTRTE